MHRHGRKVLAGTLDIPVAYLLPKHLRIPRQYYGQETCEQCIEVRREHAAAGLGAGLPPK